MLDLKQNIMLNQYHKLLYSVLSLSVVCPTPPIFSKQVSLRNFSNLVETWRWKGANLRSKGQRSRSLGNEKVKVVFRAYLIPQAWIELYVSPRPRRPCSGPFYT